jgi:hypothetical protein
MVLVIGMSRGNIADYLQGERNSVGMRKEDIEYYFSLLGEQLEELGQRKTVHLYMIGGGFMLTQVGNRDFTKDIDVFVKGIRNLRYSDEYHIFRQAVRFVASDTHISEAWLSYNMSDFVTSAGRVPNGKLWRKFGRRLEVYIPPKDFILAHKLVAGREKDLDDIEVLLDELGIRNRKQAQKIIDTYIKKEVQRVEGAQSTLDTFFSD